MKIGMIGCGVISRQYLESFDRLPDVQLVAVADLDRVRAEAAAEGREGVRVLSVDELIADAEVDTVLNLTIPAAHAEVDLRAIAAGKNVYSGSPSRSPPWRAPACWRPPRRRGSSPAPPPTPCSAPAPRPPAP